MYLYERIEAFESYVNESRACALIAHAMDYDLIPSTFQSIELLEALKAMREQRRRDWIRREREEKERAFQLADLALSDWLPGQRYRWIDEDACIVNSRQRDAVVSIIAKGLLRGAGRLDYLRVSRLGPYSKNLWVQVWIGGNRNTVGDNYKTYGTFSVGPRGGVKAHVTERKSLARKHPFIYGWNY